MVNIIPETPGKAAKAFCRQCVHYIVRTLEGEASLWRRCDRAGLNSRAARLLPLETKD
jgi:hypothetical protein